MCDQQYYITNHFISIEIVHKQCGDLNKVKQVFDERTFVWINSIYIFKKVYIYVLNYSKLSKLLCACQGITSYSEN